MTSDWNWRLSSSVKSSRDGRSPVKKDRWRLHWRGSKGEDIAAGDAVGSGARAGDKDFPCGGPGRENEDETAGVEVGNVIAPGDDVDIGLTGTPFIIIGPVTDGCKTCTGKGSESEGSVLAMGIDCEDSGGQRVLGAAETIIDVFVSALLTDTILLFLGGENSDAVSIILRLFSITFSILDLTLLFWLRVLHLVGPWGDGMSLANELELSLFSSCRKSISISFFKFFAISSFRLLVLLFLKSVPKNLRCSK